MPATSPANGLTGHRVYTAGEQSERGRLLVERLIGVTGCLGEEEASL